MTKSNVVSNGFSFGVRKVSGWDELVVVLVVEGWFETRRIVVVGCCFVGVVDAPSPRPRLSRASGGAGSPGRSEHPGRGSPFDEKDMRVCGAVAGSKVKLSLIGGVAGRTAE